MALIEEEEQQVLRPSGVGPTPVRGQAPSARAPTQLEEDLREFMNETASARLRGVRASDTSPYKKVKKVLKEKTGRVPALQKLWDDPARWKSVARGHWQFPDEPIHVLEGRTALMAIRHAATSGRARRCKLLTLCDNTVCCLDFDRGRARQSYGMLVLTRRAAAYEIGLPRSSNRPLYRLATGKSVANRCVGKAKSLYWPVRSCTGRFGLNRLLYRTVRQKMCWFALKIGRFVNL